MPRQQWEYTSLAFALRSLLDIPSGEETNDAEETTINDILQSWGEEGWELVSVNAASAATPQFEEHTVDILYTFKRSKNGE